MKHPQHIAIIILSIALLTGATTLYKRNTRPFSTITIQENGIKEELSLEQVEARLKEARRIDINTATMEDITTIPGIGEVLATRIVEYRNINGQFYSPNDLLQVKGVGDKKLEKIREYIKIN
ncbi:MAG: helix-hairpin-helix domain-containing protein [Candidatus Tantalella remota]|nr:helix-hairpin-helix domain-containing protein [Candidatus Tantalella remota]